MFMIDLNQLVLLRKEQSKTRSRSDGEKVGILTICQYRREYSVVFKLVMYSRQILME
jgi:hypothetical protein